MTEIPSADRPALAAAIITNAGCVLLAKRRVPEGDLAWQFPAGELNPGESPEEGAVREAHEEVGLTVMPRQVLGDRVHPATDRHIFYVACDVIDGLASVADAAELSDVAWVPVEQLERYVPAGVYAPVESYLRAQA